MPFSVVSVGAMAHDHVAIEEHKVRLLCLHGTHDARPYLGVLQPFGILTGQWQGCRIWVNRILTRIANSGESQNNWVAGGCQYSIGLK